MSALYNLKEQPEAHARFPRSKKILSKLWPFTRHVIGLQQRQHPAAPAFLASAIIICQIMSGVVSASAFEALQMCPAGEIKSDRPQ